MSMFDELNGFDELHGYWIEDLEVGQTVVSSRTITEAAVELFGGISGDLNPTHFSDDFAKKERFGKRIVHGMLTMSHITGTLASKLPGPGCLYMSQSVKFLAPVNIGDCVTTKVEIKDIDAKKGKVTLKTDQFVGKTQCVDGEALLWVPSKASKK
uniref:3-hydroxybutyryl-CoA dehydratase n=1 Tax=Candidatus Kentrum sp. FW TaxID=2126338 RepID=A0A450TGA7_9GAMM|nr:MAG: 3-hydroxybutyryl-CoA dehydratase [Candidatus Kentron sp. FW]VFJ66191.1 MAG: 3-hydroxybutyryl-CoA dehydratase [Candidatus Kentron sp. FW]VFJ77834.1 MAG: 3-hydroxybutyryl-CoA dehydratase [Candidatus Kentron sp. FW]